MQNDVEQNIHAILYTHPQSDLSADDLDALNALPIADVVPIIRAVYTTETDRNTLIAS